MKGNYRGHFLFGEFSCSTVTTIQWRRGVQAEGRARVQRCRWFSVEDNLPENMSQVLSALSLDDEEERRQTDRLLDGPRLLRPSPSSCMPQTTSQLTHSRFDTLMSLGNGVLLEYPKPHLACSNVHTICNFETSA